MENRRNTLQFHYLEINSENLILEVRIVSCGFRVPPSPSAVPSENLRTTVPNIPFGLGIQVRVSWMRGRGFAQKKTSRGCYSLREVAERLGHSWEHGSPRGHWRTIHLAAVDWEIGQSSEITVIAIAPFGEAKPKLNPSLLGYIECLLFPQLNPDHLLFFYFKHFFINVSKFSFHLFFPTS